MSIERRVGQVGSVAIPFRFRGPPESGNGGYSCGLVASYLPGAAEVTLRKPPPLDTPLDVVKGADGRVELRAGDVLIADGATADVDLTVPAMPVDFATAEAASRRYPGFHLHLFPGCFVCGPERGVGDGLRIFTGGVGEHQVVAPWVPDATLGDDAGQVRPVFLWSALDCPGYWAAVEGEAMRPAVLGRMAAKLIGGVHIGERCVVAGWRIAQDGRKHTVGTALYGEDGALRAVARAVWIELRSE